MIWKASIGQDSHRFEEKKTGKKLMLGGVEIPNHPALEGNSDADVILHAITNAVSGITGNNILGFEADEMAARGIKDSSRYLLKALESLPPFSIEHLSISVECSKPVLKPHLGGIKENISKLLDVSPQQIGITATSGEGLTDFGKGLGIQCFTILSVCKP